MGLLDLIKRSVAQVNPLDNGRTFKNQTPTNQRSVGAQLIHNGVTNTAGNFVKPFTNTATSVFVEPARALTAQVTGDRAAMNAANFRRDQAANNSIGGLFFHGVQPLEQSIASTILSPYANRVGNTQEEYAKRVLTKAYGGSPIARAQAEAEAGRAKLGIINDPLNRAGTDYRDPLSTTSRKVAGQAGQAGTTVVTAGSIPEVGTALGGVKPALAQAGLFGALQGANNVGGVAQQEAPKLTDYLKQGAIGVGQGAVLPLALGVAPTAIAGAAKVTKGQAKDLKELMVGNPRPFKNISDGEVAAVNRVQKSLAGWGDNMSNVQPGDTQVYRSVQRKLGAEVNDRAKIDEAMGAIRTYEARKGQLQGGYIGLGKQKEPSANAPEGSIASTSSRSTSSPPAPLPATGLKQPVGRREQGDVSSLPPNNALIDNKVNVPTLKDKATKTNFMDATNRHLGTIEAGKTDALATVKQLPKLDQKSSLGLIDSLEHGANSGDFGGAPAQIRQILDAKVQQLQAAGIDIGYLKDYFPHKWQGATDQQVSEAFMKLNLRNGIQEARAIPTVNEGLALGFKPATTDYRQALATYLNAANRLLANRDYFQTLKERGLIVESGQRPRGMQLVDAPGLPQPKPEYQSMLDDAGGAVTAIGQPNYYASPDVAKQLGRLFGPQDSPKALQLAAKASSKVQQVTLAGGLPLTPLNSFGIAQWTKQALSGRPISATRSFLRAFSGGRSERYFRDNASYITKMQSEGIPFHASINDPQTLKSFGDQLSASAGVTGKAKTAIQEGWNLLVEDPTFQRLMPSLQLDTFKATFDRLVKHGIDQGSAATQAAEATKNAFGLNSLAKDALKSKVGKDVYSAVLFAPRFRESMVNFWVNNLKALGKPTSPAYRENVKFLAGAAALFAGMQAANMALNGGNSTFQNGNPNDRLNLSIPSGGGKSVSVPFLSSTATVPRILANSIADLVTGKPKDAGLEAKKLLSQTVRPGVDLATNQKYNGRPVYNPTDPATTRLKDQAAYVAGQFNHPYVQSAIGVATGKTSGPLETASTALELPLRFRGAYTPKATAAAGDWKAAFNSPAGQAFLNHTEAEKIALAKTDPQAKAFLELQNAAKRSTTTPVLPSGISKQSTDILTKYARMTDTGRQQYLASNKDAEYKLAAAAYEKQKAAGAMSDVQAISAQQRLAKLQVGTSYDKSVRDLYGLSKDNIAGYLSSHPNGATLSNQLVSYDNALVSAGVISTPKFKTGIATSSKSRRTKAPKIRTFTTKGRIGSVPRLLQPKAIKSPKVAVRKRARV